MIPRQAVEFDYTRPKDMGGVLANYPILQKDQQYGLFKEVNTAWFGADSGIWQQGGKGPPAWFDKPDFNAEVWTVQWSNNQPGYYVNPQQIDMAAERTAYWASEGIGSWTMRSGWESYGAAPVG